jgi:hypothetical protein
MNRKELEAHLQEHLSAPQASERWAMYRLITPIVDYANNSLKLKPYYEFNQNSSHGTHQSVDIALLDQNSNPVVLVEAKCWDRGISAEQIDKYLESGVRGVVHHGFIPIFSESLLQRKNLDKVVAFLRGQHQSDLLFLEEPQVYRTDIKPWSIKKKIKAARKVHPKAVAKSISEFESFIDSLDKSPSTERKLLTSIKNTLKERGIPSFLRIEVRKTRISLFDDRREGRKQRIARIELGKQQPDVLVLTEITKQNADLSSVTKPYIHDKGGHMRRFRIPNDEAAIKFGQYLVIALK